MLKAQSATSWICGDSLQRSRATVMAASSAPLIVSLSFFDLIPICVVVWVRRFFRFVCMYEAIGVPCCM